jgi:hypothetical protein
MMLPASTPTPSSETAMAEPIMVFVFILLVSFLMYLPPLLVAVGFYRLRTVTARGLYDSTLAPTN